MSLPQENQLNLFAVASSNDLPLTTVAKLLNFPPHQFIKWLAEHKYIFRRKVAQSWEAYQTYVTKGLFRHHAIMILHKSGEVIPHPQVKITPEGFLFFKNLIKTS